MISNLSKFMYLLYICIYCIHIGMCVVLTGFNHCQPVAPFFSHPNLQLSRSKTTLARTTPHQRGGKTRPFSAQDFATLRSSNGPCDVFPPPPPPTFASGRKTQRTKTQKITQHRPRPLAPVKIVEYHRHTHTLGGFTHAPVL